MGVWVGSMSVWVVVGIRLGVGGRSRGWWFVVQPCTRHKRTCQVRGFGEACALWSGVSQWRQRRTMRLGWGVGLISSVRMTGGPLRTCTPYIRPLRLTVRARRDLCRHLGLRGKSQNRQAGLSVPIPTSVGASPAERSEASDRTSPSRGGASPHLVHLACPLHSLALVVGGTTHGSYCR